MPKSTQKHIKSTYMKNLTREEIIENLRRIVEGDSYNDAESLYSSLKLLTSEAALLPENNK